MSDLTPKQKRFVDEYLVDLNAAQAAIRAGYSEKTAKEIGCENLTKPNIAAAIEEERLKLGKRTNITQERVLQEYGRLAFLDIRKAFDDNGNLKHIQDLDDDTAAAIAGLEVQVEKSKGTDEEGKSLLEITRTHKIKLSDKKGALDSIAKHLGMFVDKHEIKGTLTLAQLVEASLPEPKDAGV